MIVKTDESLEKKDQEYTMEAVAVAVKPSKSDDDYNTPKYMKRLKLSKEQEERLVKEIWDELDAIKKERDAKKLDSKWRALDNQYEGNVEEDSLRQFNLCRRVTKVKADTVERLIMKASWKSDPLFSISARPQFEREGGRETTEAQEDFLDYKFDNDIPFIAPQRKTIHSAIVKGTGILKWFHVLKREKRIREETYDGSKTEVTMIQGQQAILNKGLESFVKAYPDAKTEYMTFYNKLLSGKKIEIVVKYEETIYNDPLPTNVPLKDFYVRTATKGYEGLKDTQLIVERQNYNWWEMKQMEREKKFYNIDELMYKSGDKDRMKNDREKKANYANESFDVLECTYYFRMKDDVVSSNDSESSPDKIIVWIAEERKMVIGCIRYPYYAIPCIYVPHYISSIWDGFYQPGLAEYITDNNIAENAILNFTLEGALAANTITPIADINNPVHAQFLDKRWTHGVPIETKDGKPIDFLQKYIGGFNHQQLLSMMEWLSRDDGNLTVNDLVSGRESEIDPTAPAKKTMMLLQQSGISVEDYVDVIAKSFEITAGIVLQLYYQMSEEGLQYSPRPERVTGDPETFKKISKSDMKARTNIQSQAKSFNFDSVNEKVEDLAFFQTFRAEPIIARNPDAIYKMLKIIMKGWSKKWKNNVEQILPPLADFKKEQQMMVAQGVAQFLKEMMTSAAQAGQSELPMDPEAIAGQLMQVIETLMKDQATNPSEDEIKEMEKQENVS